MVSIPELPNVSEVASRWLALYVRTCRTGKNVAMTAQRVRDYVDPSIGNIALHALQPDDLRAHRLWLESQGLAPRTVRHLLTDLRCMLNWAVDSRLIERSPFPMRIMPRIEELPPDRLSDAEVSAILEVGEPYAFVLRLGLSTGLRWGELCRSEAGHLDGRMLLVPHTKAGRFRRVPLPDVLREEILPREGRLVRFSVLGPSSFADAVRARSGVRRFHVHQLRHTFACKWIERGGSLPALQQILGHVSIVTTQHYARLSDEAVRREAARITGAANAWYLPDATGAN